MKKCTERGKVVIPKQPIPIKFLHLFLKREELYSNIQNFLHFLLRCVMKTHSETVVESMGNLVEMHCEKRHGLGIEDPKLSNPSHHLGTEKFRNILLFEEPPPLMNLGTLILVSLIVLTLRAPN